MEIFHRGTGKYFRSKISDNFFFDSLHSAYENNIGDAGAKSIAEVLQVNNILTTLG